VKRLAAILFICIVVFNLFGYYLLVTYLQAQQDHRLIIQLDKNTYQEKDLVYIKIPVHLPYYNTTNKFEKVTGSVEHNGIQYNYVKRRILNDTIELACLPNFDNVKFESLKNSYSKWNSDSQNNNQEKKSNWNIQNISPEFCNRLLTYNFNIDGNLTIHAGLKNTQIIPFVFVDKPEQPPQPFSATI
jgi:hypothetical protein